jgi:Holliday junction resolvasome RuvABC endonuclease subunit
MRYLRFQRWLEEMISPAESEPQIDRIVFEEVRRHCGVDAAHAYGGFMSHLQSTCERLEIPYEGVPVGTIKRHATGKGNAGKELVIAAMRARGHVPKDDNEADALALLYYSIEK